MGRYTSKKLGKNRKLSFKNKNIEKRNITFEGPKLFGGDDKNESTSVVTIYPYTSTIHILGMNNEIITTIKRDTNVYDNTKAIEDLLEKTTTTLNDINTKFTDVVKFIMSKNGAIDYKESKVLGLFSTPITKIIAKIRTKQSELDNLTITESDVSNKKTEFNKILDDSNKSIELIDLNTIGRINRDLIVGLGLLTEKTNILGMSNINKLIGKQTTILNNEIQPLIEKLTVIKEQILQQIKAINNND